MAVPMRCYSVRQNARRLYDLNSITSFARAVAKTNGFQDPTASEQFTPSQNMGAEARAALYASRKTTKTHGFHAPAASEQFTPSQNMGVEAEARAQQHWRLKNERCRERFWNPPQHVFFWIIFEILGPILGSKNKPGRRARFRTPLIRIY